MGTRQKKKERITEHPRQQFLDGASTVFSQEAFGEPTTSDVTREAGIAVITIYNCCESKRDPMVALVADYGLTNPFLRLWEHQPETDDDGFFGLLMEESLDFLCLNFDRLALVFSELKHDPESKAQYVDQVLKPTFRRMEGYLESRMASRVFRTTDPGVAARAIDGMVIGFALLGRLEGDNRPFRDISKGELAERLGTGFRGVQT